MGNPYETTEYIKIELAKSIHNLKLAVKASDNFDDLNKVLFKVQHLNMELRQVGPGCGPDGHEGFVDSLEAHRDRAVAYINKMCDDII